jgi:PhnB protein
MPAKVQPIPEGFHSITPHLVVNDAAGAIEFYKKAFGAQEIHRMPMPSGDKLMHAMIRIGDSFIMMADEFPDMKCVGPKSLGGSPVTLHLYVNDVDAAFKRAVDAGCTVSMPLDDMFWGDRYGKVVDPYGHHWSLAMHIKDQSEKEMAEAAAKAFA